MLSRRRFLIAGLVTGAGALLAACAAAVQSVLPSATASSSPSPTPSPSPSATPSPTPSPSPSPVGPSLRERIGQMLLVGFRGLTADAADATRQQIAAGEIGGILLFSVDQLTGGLRNVDSPEQLRGLVDALSASAPGSPLAVAIDQEGGMVARLGPAHGFPATSSAATLGQGDPSATAAAARAMAETLRSVGVTLNLAPVVDLAVNPDNPIIAAVERSFSADPDVVIAHASAFIQAHHDIGVRSAIKHFPGQGSATGDTHAGVVDVTDVWTDVELEPFAALVGQRLPDAVLTAHIFNGRLDPDHPATLSKPTITGILRGQLGWDGAVISDDMQMGAIRDAYGYEEAVALAIEAGVDILLIANQLVYEPDIAPRTIDIIEGLVRDGRITEERIDASYRRILALKAVAG
ncbi:MAG TPA: glycoside hydrolase family 3 N-terminal domain-containing protein [Candidatus Limnocylindria bacterium]|nr:glycoside hydrolase family 3 N-terminal domain-containing protein [Candidatus Limnocylindria bacterium]